MLNWLQRIFDERGLAPHGYCLLWDSALIGLHVVSDAVIAASYFSIPLVLGVLLSRRRDIEFGWVLALFGLFILACGTTHLMSILTLWVPAYGIEGAIKALTAAVSLATAAALWPLLPRLVAIPSPTQLRRVNDELRRESGERQAAEERLRQAHKLEAIGQLTGGIAHDFNNLLTVVLGNLDRAARHVPEGNPARRNLANALTATERAAGLTDQLLTFARKRPPQVTRFDLHAATASLCALLESTVGAKISLRCHLDRDAWVECDRELLESAILNLAINARDAMPDGGELALAGLRGADGRVGLSVTDTGLGMSEAVRARATEPFFTTKPIGQGTGLGLSQVYGFVTQAGGEVEIASSPGTGTRVTIWLPDAAAPTAAETGSPATGSQGGQGDGAYSAGRG